MVIKMEAIYLDNIKKITGKDVYLFFTSFIDYMVGPARSSIQNYYLGKEAINPKFFKELDRLYYESKDITNSLIQRKNTFSFGQYWEILDKVEDTTQKLESLKNISKYLNSSLVKGSHVEQKRNLILKQGDSIEKTIKDQAFDLDYQNSWATLAVKNNIREEDYNLSGGLLLKANLNSTQPSSSNADVIGDLSGNNFYGKDIDKEIILDEIEGDFKIWTNEETLKESASILANWEKGDVPEFPDLGRPKIIGGNIASLSYPTIFKNLLEVFALDDTFSWVGLNNISFQEDLIALSVTIQTKDRENVEQEIRI